MAISFDSSSTVNSTTSVTDTPQTWSHTCSGQNRILIVYTYNVTSSTSVTGVTYNGVAMTKIIDDTQNFRNTCWILLNPSTGTNNVSVTFSSSSTGTTYLYAVSYTGVSDYDSSNFSINLVVSTQLSITTTVSNNNEWVVGCLTSSSVDGNDTYTNATKRIMLNTKSCGSIFDTNGTVNQGNYTITLTGTSMKRNLISVSLIPASTTSIKSINGLAYSSVKSYNGLAISSIKSINSLI